MAKLIYNSESEENREASIIEFTISEDLDIYEFKVVCMRLASAMGYTGNTIKKAFGNEEHLTKEDMEFKQFISSLFTTTASGSLHTI